MNVGEDATNLRTNLDRAVSRCCPAWLHSHREDIVQSSLMKVMNAMRRHAEPPPITRGYLRRVAHTAVVDEIRRFKRRRITLVCDDGLDRIAAPVHESVHAKAAGRELHQAVTQCLGEMNHSRRSAVTLYLQGQRATEIAARLGCDRKRADNLAHRGIKQLRTRLAELGYGEHAA